jgi:hypothetical protein
MTPEEIRRLANSAISEINRNESGGCPSGTTVQTLILAEIAAQLAQLNENFCTHFFDNQMR